MQRRQLLPQTGGGHRRLADVGSRGRRNGAPVRIGRLLVAFAVATSLAFGLAATPARAATLFYLYNVNNDTCADLPYWDGVGNDTLVTQYGCMDVHDNQLWTISTHGANWQFHHADSPGKCLDLPGIDAVPAGTFVTVFECRGSADNQYFRVVNRGFERGYIVHVKSGLCLDVAGYRDTGYGLPLTLYHCSWGDDSRDDHLWWPMQPV